MSEYKKGPVLAPGKVASSGKKLLRFSSHAFLYCLVETKKSPQK